MTTRSHDHALDEHVALATPRPEHHPHSLVARSHSLQDAAAQRMNRITMFLGAHFGHIRSEPQVAKEGSEKGDDEGTTIVRQATSIWSTCGDGHAKIGLLDLV